MAETPGTPPPSSPVEALVPYKNVKALIAYYCGIFSIIPGLGILLGPIALVTGFMGRAEAQRNPAVRGAGHAWAGIIIGGIVTLLYLLLLVRIISLNMSSS